MKKFFVALTVLLCMVTASTVFAASVAEQRAQINQLHEKTLQKLYEKYPHAPRVINNCYSYATLSNSGVKVLFIGSNHHIR